MLVNVCIYKLDDDYLQTFKFANLSESDCSHTATDLLLGFFFFFYRAVKLIKKTTKIDILRVN